MQTDIHTTTNTIEIEATATHVNGQKMTVNIQPNRALIDDEGCIRFFTVDFDNGESHGYKLHPYHNRTEGNILWAVDFLAGFGLSRAGSSLVKADKYGRASEALHVGRYFTFSNPGGQWIRTFISTHFMPEHLGYHNILSDKLIFTDPLYVNGRWR